MYEYETFQYIPEVIIAMCIIGIYYYCTEAKRK